jgi:hypothetical protein
MRILLASLLLCVPSQEDEVTELIRQLGSRDFEEQGLAAKALERMGPRALPPLRKAALGDDADLKAWAVRILPRLEAQDKRLRELIVRLGSADDEEKEAAEAELAKIGAAAVPYLKEASGSDNKNLRLRAGRLLKALDRPIAGDGQVFMRAGFHSRLGGRRNRVAIAGGGGDTEDAVLAALKWLSRHPSADGSWSARDYGDRCNRLPKYAGGAKCAPASGDSDFDAGVTGLALLAFLGSGYSQLSLDTYDGICFGDVVRKGLAWIVSKQDPDGCIGSRNTQKYVYNHATCAAALVEAYGLTREAELREPARKAVDFLVAAQNPGKGWRYGFKSGDNDTSVTGWAVAALRSAELAGLAFPRRTFDGAHAWLDEVTDPDFNRAGYTHPGTGKVFVPGKNEAFNHHETLTAIAVYGRIVMNKRRHDARLERGVDLLLKDLPSWNANDIDFLYWYYGTLALFQHDGPAGVKWKTWNNALKTALVKNQCAGKDGCRNGSWEPVDRWSFEGGRVYGTALNALTLETYYRYELVPAAPR